MSYTTPDLPYSYDALEPYIDEQTMRLHHDKHHTGYTAKLNGAVAGTEFEKKDPVELLRSLDALPESIRTTVRNNGGGHVNHALFWEIMGPKSGGEPGGDLADRIRSAFGGFDAFREKFTDAAVSRFGSGWAWLAVRPSGELALYSTPNQDSPWMQGDVPILGLDVWEHAYYLKYQNRRPEYIDNFYRVVNWDAVARKLKEAKSR